MMCICNSPTWSYTYSPVAHGLIWLRIQRTCIHTAPLSFASGARSNFCRAAVTSGRLFLLVLRYSYQTERWRNQCKWLQKGNCICRRFFDFVYCQRCAYLHVSPDGLLVTFDPSDQHSLQQARTCSYCKRELAVNTNPGSHCLGG